MAQSCPLSSICTNWQKSRKPFKSPEELVHSERQGTWSHCFARTLFFFSSNSTIRRSARQILRVRQRSDAMSAEFQMRIGNIAMAKISNRDCGIGPESSHQTQSTRIAKFNPQVITPCRYTFKPFRMVATVSSRGFASGFSRIGLFSASTTL